MFRRASAAVLFPLAVVAAEPATFCNPLNLDYGWSAGGRHSADPVVVPFKGAYYLFATDDVCGYRRSTNLLDWTRIDFAPELRPLVTDNGKTYCAPAVAADTGHVYFIRMQRGGDAKTVPVLRSADPASGRWEKFAEIRRTPDPALIFDEDGRCYLYHGLGKDLKVIELDPTTMTEIPGTEKLIRPAAKSLDELRGGWERGRRELRDEVDTGAWLDRFAMLPCQEASWMTRVGTKYLFQYSSPGTVCAWYSDGVLEGASPTGPFREVDWSPVAMKVGGFIGSAGHSCVFRDFHGNWWRITTMWVGVHDAFERRLGLFPVGFDAQGRMFTETALGDLPQIMPQGPRDPAVPFLAGWWLQSRGAVCAASSSLSNHPPALAADENVRTWWSAETGRAGEWFRMDLGRPRRVQAVQVNFAEQDTKPPALQFPGDRIRYRLLGSEDGATWRVLVDRGAAETSLPHDYHVLPSSLLRHLRVENVEVPAGGKFALRDLRVFGHGGGDPPRPVGAPTVRRHTDSRDATIEWTLSPDAGGYLVRHGIAADRLFNAFQVQGGSVTSLTTHALNRDVNYVWRIDAYNANGVSEGANR